MLTEKNTRLYVLTGIVLFAAMTRLIPHPVNFTPVLAIALFGGAYFSNQRWAYTVPLLAMVVSDVALYFLHGYAVLTPMRGIVYLCLLGAVGFGGYFLQDRSALRVGLGAVGSGVGFFLITNFAVWAQGSMYPLTLSGLLECYIAALPFFRNTLLSTIAYSAVLFGVFEWARRRYAVLAAA